MNARVMLVVTIASLAGMLLIVYGGSRGSTALGEEGETYVWVLDEVKFTAETTHTGGTGEAGTWLSDPQYAGSERKITVSRTSITISEVVLQRGNELGNFKLTASFDALPEEITAGKEVKIKNKIEGTGNDNFQWSYGGNQRQETIINAISGPYESVFEFEPYWTDEEGDTFEVTASVWNCPECNITFVYKAKLAGSAGDESDDEIEDSSDSVEEPEKACPAISGNGALVGHVQTATGEGIKYYRADGSEVTPYGGMPVYAGDRIETGAAETGARSYLRPHVQLIIFKPDILDGSQEIIERPRRDAHGNWTIPDRFRVPSSDSFEKFKDTLDNHSRVRNESGEREVFVDWSKRFRPSQINVGYGDLNFFGNYLSAVEINGFPLYVDENDTFCVGEEIESWRKRHAKGIVDWFRDFIRRPGPGENRPKINASLSGWNWRRWIDSITGSGPSDDDLIFQVGWVPDKGNNLYTSIAKYQSTTVKSSIALE